jgi:uncharacterized protein (DUF2236 family)
MFDQTSAARCIAGESALLLGGGRALLMQLAHPSVAAGVAEHSRFEDHPLLRLQRTLRPTYTMVFGTPRQARAAAARIRARHRGVIGPGYDASDPALTMWVHATLVDTALVTYEAFVGPLSRREREAYYVEMRRVCALLGVPEDKQPADLAAFEDYVAAMIATLEVSAQARRVASILLAPRPLSLAPLKLLAREVTIALLPSPLRRGYDLHLTPLEAEAVEAAMQLSRWLVPRLPRALRRPPGVFMPPSDRARPAHTLRDSVFP